MEVGWSAELGKAGLRNDPVVRKFEQGHLESSTFESRPIAEHIEKQGTYLNVMILPLEQLGR